MVLLKTMFTFKVTLAVATFVICTSATLVNAVCTLEFILWDADTDLEIGTFEEAMDINGIFCIPEHKINIEARPSIDCSVTESVTMRLRGPRIGRTTRTDNVLPFTIFGDRENDILGRTFREGSFVLIAQAYSEKFRQGSLVKKRIMRFQAQKHCPESVQQESCVRDSLELHSALDAASVDADHPTIIQLCGDIVLVKEMNMNGKSFVLECEAAETSCVLDSQGKTRHFVGAPINATFRNIQFTNGNSGSHNGGSFLLEGDAKITFQDCQFYDNKSDAMGGVLYLDGNALDVKVWGCELARNQAGLDGGAFYLKNGFLTLRGSGGDVYGDPTIITSNSAKQGGAIYLETGGTFVAESSKFFKNTAANSGGAVYFHSVLNAVILECDFFDNKASIEHGDGGGAIASFESRLRLVGVRFAGNTASEGLDVLIIDDTDPANGGSFVECYKLPEESVVIFCDGLRGLSELGTGSYENTDCPTKAFSPSTCSYFYPY